MNYTEMSVFEIKKSLGYGKNEIVDPEKFAEHLGIDLVETALDQEQDGAKIICAIVNKERPNIFYHKRLIDGSGSERVAITYALVHSLLFGKDNMMITARTIMTEKEESLVHELLMPGELVKEELKNGSSVSGLAIKYGVPKKCVRERLDCLPAVQVVGVA